MAVINGTSSANTLTGTTSADTINGLGGNDTLWGRSGADTVKGGTGNDKLYGEAGNDLLYGEDGDDYIEGREDKDQIWGGAGNDLLSGGSGDDIVRGEANNDTVSGNDGNDQLSGGTGDDVVLGGLGADKLWGDAGNDHLEGGAGNDRLYGDAGNDVLDGGIWDTDTADYSLATSGVTVDLGLDGAQNTSGAGIDTLINIENLVGSAFNDRLTAVYSARLEGGAGNDRLVGRNGDDVLDGGTGNDQLYGNDNSDLLIGGAGNDLLDGGANESWGADTASYASATSGVKVNLGLTSAQATGGAGTDTLLNIEDLVGSGFNDTLTGNGVANRIDAGAGNDTVAGGGGNDLLIGGTGNDRLDGGSGVDLVDYRSATSAITVNLGLTSAQATGGAGTDTLISIENLIGSRFNDALTGSSSDNQLEGGAGNDRLNGGAGQDTAIYSSATSGVTVNLNLTTAQATGGAGTDTLSSIEHLVGSAFDDVLTGTAGNNRLDGGGGSDTVSYAAATGGVTVDLGSGQATGGAGTDTLIDIENLIGSKFNDRLTAGSSKSVLEGGAGNDMIDGGQPYYATTASYASATSGVMVNLSLTTAQATGGAGTDTLRGIDHLIGSKFNDRLTGDAGDNYLDGGLGNDVLDGGDGWDTVAYTSATAGVTVSLTSNGTQTTGSAGTDTLISIERVMGSDFADHLTGSALDDTIIGGKGGDTILGGAGNDQIFGETSDTDWDWDHLPAYTNTLDGGLGDDLIVGSIGADIAFGGDGDDQIWLGTLYQDSMMESDRSTNRASGGAGNDGIIGGDGVDTIEGNDGNDSIAGAYGNDVIIGGNGNDHISGGADDDRLTGGAGKDVFIHGFGYDRESFIDDGSAGNDFITDFVKGQDSLEIYMYWSSTADEPNPSWDLDLAVLDSNGNGLLDNNDRYVDIQQVTDAGVTRASTIIYTSDMLNAANVGDPWPWGASKVTLFNVTGLSTTDVQVSF